MLIIGAHGTQTGSPSGILLGCHKVYIHFQTVQGFYIAKTESAQRRKVIADTTVKEITGAYYTTVSLKPPAKSVYYIRHNSTMRLYLY